MQLRHHCICHVHAMRLRDHVEPPSVRAEDFGSHRLTLARRTRGTHRSTRGHGKKANVRSAPFDELTREQGSSIYQSKQSEQWMSR